MTVEEFDRLQEPEELRYELDEGELIETTKPKYNPHNRIVRTIDRALLAYLDKNPIGEVLSSDNLFVLGPTTKRIPDLSFLTTARVHQIGDGDIQGTTAPSSETRTGAPVVHRPCTLQAACAGENP